MVNLRRPAATVTKVDEPLHSVGHALDGPCRASGRLHDEFKRFAPSTFLMLQLDKGADKNNAAASASGDSAARSHHRAAPPCITRASWVEYLV